MLRYLITKRNERRQEVSSLVVSEKISKQIEKCFGRQFIRRAMPPIVRLATDMSIIGDRLIDRIPHGNDIIEIVSVP
jgi:hypothetical protein